MKGRPRVLLGLEWDSKLEADGIGKRAGVEVWMPLDLEFGLGSGVEPKLSPACAFAGFLLLQTQNLSLPCGWALL